MSTVGFSKGDSSANYTSFRGDGILANYDKPIKEQLRDGDYDEE